MLHVIAVLIVVGILLWVINQFLSGYMDAKILQIINIVVVLCVILWLLSVFGILSAVDVPAPRFDNGRVR